MSLQICNNCKLKYSSLEYVLWQLTNETLADILCELNSEFCLVKNMVNWKRESFIDAIMQEVKDDYSRAV